MPEAGNPQNGESPQNDGENANQQSRSFERTRRTVENVSETAKNLAESFSNFGIFGLLFGGTVMKAIWIAVGLGAAGVVGHYFYDSSYEDDYKNALAGQDGLADKSAQACGLGNPEEMSEIFAHVVSDVKGSTKNGWLNWIPVVGDWIPKLTWLPNKQAYDAVMVANDNDIALYPAGWFSGYKNGIQAVLYNDGDTKVLNYKSLNDGQFGLMMDYVEKNGVEPGALVLVWNSATEEYETVRISQEKLANAEGPVSFGMNGVYENSLILPANKCGVDTSLSGKFKDWVGFGNDDEEVEKDSPAEPEQGDDGWFSGWFSGWFGGGEADTATDEVIEEVAEESETGEAVLPPEEGAEETETVAEEPAERKDESWFRIPELPSFGFGDDDAKTAPAEDAAPAAIPAPAGPQ